MFLRKNILMIVIILLGTESPAQVDTDDLPAKINRIIAPYVAAGDFMGVVAVQRDGEAPLILPYGLADVELGVPHRATDIFMVGSISKHFTAVAIMLLEEDGLLTTDDLVSRHLPEFPYGDQMTIEHLLTHKAGLADVFALKRFGDSAGQVGTLEQVIEDLGKVDLAFAPGTGYAYSNGGYAVLAGIIERVSGLSYGEFLDLRLFKMLGMSSTAHGNPGRVVKNRVAGYDPWGSTDLMPTVPPAAEFTAGSGSLWSSATDMLTWTSALHTGRILSKASYTKLTRDYGNGYGYGLSVFKRFGRDVIGHDGRITGYVGDVARYVEDRTSIVLLSNVQSVARDEIRQLVAAAVFGEPYELPKKNRPQSRTAVSADELVGVYEFGPGFHVFVSAPDGRVLARANQGSYSELIPISDTAWFSRVLYVTVRFGRDEAGRVDRLIWGPGDRAPTGRRIR